MLDPKKGRRNGGVITDGITYGGVIPDHYFGYYTTLRAYHNQLNTSSHATKYYTGRMKTKHTSEHL